MHETLRLLIEKKNMLQQELAIAYDVEKKFPLERQIEKIEKDLVGLRVKAGELETKMAQTHKGAP